jgi:hypothetical protein
MITFKIASSKYKIPTTWTDVTFDQYVFHVIPRTLTETISCFTGIPIETLVNSKLNNIDKISLALAFMTLSPKMDKTEIVGNYIMPGKPEFESLAQFEDLRNTIRKLPQKKREEYDYSDLEQECETYLQACAIYCQKVRDGVYNSDKVEEVKDELRNRSCVEVISNGAFFLSLALNIQPQYPSLYQRVTQRLRRWVQELPGYQKTLDFLLRSSK